MLNYLQKSIYCITNGYLIDHPIKGISKRSGNLVSRKEEIVRNGIVA